MIYVRFLVYLIARIYKAGFWGFVLYVLLWIGPLILTYRMFMSEYRWFMALARRNKE